MIKQGDIVIMFSIMMFVNASMLVMFVIIMQKIKNEVLQKEIASIKRYEKLEALVKSNFIEIVKLFNNL